MTLVCTAQIMKLNDIWDIITGRVQMTLKTSTQLLRVKGGGRR